MPKRPSTPVISILNTLLLHKMQDKSESCLSQFCNCWLLREHSLVKDDLWVRDGKIMNPEKLFFDELVYADIQIDCQGAIISPGFIDVQINGAFGIDFSMETDHFENEVQKVAKGLLAHGVTSFCPTIITSPRKLYHKVLPQMKKKDGSKEGAGNLGVHIEGPFISKEKKGAHPENLIRKFENGFDSVIDMYGNLDNIAIITLAPELERAGEVISELANRGIKVSVGHSVANLIQGEEAVRQGATFITHLFNAMLPFHHRDPHLVGLLASSKLPEDSSVFYGLISDGIHTHPATLRIAYKVHPKGLILVTDAIPAMALPAGHHHIGEQKIEIKGNRALIAGTETLCGSIASMDTCVRHFAKSTDCGVVKAMESASLHPAMMLGITDRKGTLDFGTDADFILLDQKLNIKATYIAGELVWSCKGDSNVILHSLKD